MQRLEQIGARWGGLNRVAVSGGKAIVISGKGIHSAIKPASAGKTVFCHAIGEIVTIEEASSLIDLITGDDSETCISGCHFGCLGS